MEVLQFVPEHFQHLFLQPAQSCMAREIHNPEYVKSLMAAGDCYTATTNGIVVACIGLINFWPGRRHAWAFLAAEIEHQMIPLHRNVKRWLNYHGEGRIEAAVDCDHAAAIRWAEMLGFEREGRMRQYTTDGRDCFLYARVR